MPTVFGLNIILSLSGEQVKHVNYYIHNVLHLILWITLRSINYKVDIVKIGTQVLCRRQKGKVQEQPFQSEILRQYLDIDRILLSLLDAYFTQK